MKPYLKNKIGTSLFDAADGLMLDVDKGEVPLPRTEVQGFTMQDVMPVSS
jgi:hypothetical protein